MDTENELLKQKISSLEDEIVKLKEHLKKYTAPTRSKTYYENHKIVQIFLVFFIIQWR